MKDAGVGNKDYYKILGVSHAASQKKIAKAYDKRILTLINTTPNPFDSPKFKELAEAYKVLSDLEKRRAYDEALEKVSVNEDKESLKEAVKQAKSEGKVAAKEAKRKAKEAKREARKREQEKYEKERCKYNKPWCPKRAVPGETLCEYHANQEAEHARKEEEYTKRCYEAKNLKVPTISGSGQVMKMREHYLRNGYCICRLTSWYSLCDVGVLLNTLWSDVCVCGKHVASGSLLCEQHTKENNAIALHESTEGHTTDTDASEDKPSLITGTGFFITKEGHILTNHHVVDGYDTVLVKSNSCGAAAKVIYNDTTNDLAVLKALRQEAPAFVSLRSGKGIRIGDEVVVVGYPLGDVLGGGIKATTGNVAAVTGLANDTAQMQISAPIQPGSSGGPVLDKSGNLVGIVTSKLDEIAMVQAIGSLPQNVNFAIKSSSIQTFLDAHGIDYSLEASGQTLDTADIVEQAMRYTVKVQCDKPGS